ncbi:MAG: hypothetical protein AAGA22_04230 [Pseudomonadota bacterium]
MINYTKLIVVAALLAALGSAHASSPDWTPEITFGAPLKVEFRGGAIRVAGRLGVERSVCRGQHISFDVRSDDPTFFTEGNDEFEAMADGIGAAIRDACSFPERSRLRFTFRSVGANDRVVATAGWRSGFGMPTDDQLTDVYPLGPTQIVIAQPENALPDDDPNALIRRYPFFASGDVRKIRQRTGRTVVDVANFTKKLPPDELVIAYEVILVAGALYRSCTWNEDPRFGGMPAYDVDEVIPLLVQISAVETGNTDPKLADIAAKRQDLVGSAAMEWDRSMRSWTEELRLGIMNSKPWEEGGPCSDEAVRAQAQELVPLLRSPNGDALLDAFSSQAFSRLDALVALADQLP